MKYVVKQKNTQNYISISGKAYRPNCMCYKPEKMKYFDSVSDAIRHLNNMSDSDFYMFEKDYWTGAEYYPILICEAVIRKHTNEYGKQYTTVSAGDVVREIRI